MEKVIYTLGTSTRSIEEYVEILAMHGIEVLVDVRRFPKSRLEHFNRPSLRAVLAGAGIQYIYLGGELGGYRTGGYEKHMDGLTIVVGNPEEYEVGGKVAVIGGCTEDVEENWPMATGCPPAEDDVFAALCEACGAELSLVLSVRDEFRRDNWESTMHLISQ